MAHRDVTTISADKSHRQLRAALDPPAGAEEDPIGHELVGDVGLLVAMRSGFLRHPKRPFDAPDDLKPADVREWLSFELRGQPTPRARGVRADGPVGDDAWSLTEDSLGWVGRPRVMPKHLVVVGETVDDFALALAWDRMNGHSTATWIPSSILIEGDDMSLVGSFLDSLSWDLGREGGHIVATSCSLPDERTRETLAAALAHATRLIGVEDDADPKIDFVTPDRLTYEATHHLAYTQGDDYDIRLTLPIAHGESGSVQLVNPLPAVVPTALSDAGVQRPDWIVDVDLRPLAMPRGRGLRSDAMLANSNGWTPVRSARDGLSFKAHDMGFVPAAASLRQSIAQPTLRFPGLREWAQHFAAPDYEVTYSDAGRTAQICAQIWGGRASMLRELPATRPLLAELARATHSDRDFPEHDGRAITGLGTVLTFEGCHRALGEADADLSREQLDRLLDKGIIRRGLVLRCASCSGRAFLPIDELAQRNTCARCGTGRHLFKPDGIAPIRNQRGTTACTEHFGT